MRRGILYGSLAGLLGACVKEPGILLFFCWVWTFFQAWTLLLLGIALLAVASVPFALIRAAVRAWTPRQIADAVTVPLGIPFGFAVCWCLRGFLGLQGEPWNAGLVAWIPAAFGAGLGLGLGRLHDSPAYD